MLTVTFTEFRNNAKKFVDKVEKKGEMVEIYRHGKPVAILSPLKRKSQRWDTAAPVTVPGISGSKTVIEERKKSRF